MYRGKKVSQKITLLLKVPRVNSYPVGENSKNLFTLVAGAKWCKFLDIQIVDNKVEKTD
jgi:hypothetical protein